MPQHYPITCRCALAALASAVSIPHIVSALDSREPAPRFRAKTTDGETITNDSIQGKVVLLQFWATWCPYCKRDMPALESLSRDFSGQGLLILGVNVGESKKKVKDFLAQSPRSSKVILMDDTNLAALFEAKSFPLYVLIDRNGKLAGTQLGSGGEGSLRHLLQKAALESRPGLDDGFELQSSPRRQ